MHLYGLSDNPPLITLTSLSHATLDKYCLLSLSPNVCHSERSHLQQLLGSEAKRLFYRVKGNEKFCEKTAEGRWCNSTKMGGQTSYIKSVSKKAEVITLIMSY